MREVTGPSFHSSVDRALASGARGRRFESCWKHMDEKIDPNWKKPEDHGHWEGMKFIFNEPVTLQGGHIAKVIDFSRAQVEDGVRFDDIIHALLNPAYFNDEWIELK
jgi:hypothetical protein